jgi:exodeoxyribonuclease VII large subunit
MESSHTYSVSEITNRIKSTLEQAFPSVWIEGEISNFRPSGAGHLYFTLKDEAAVIQIVMFRGRATRLAFRPEDGQLVRVFGTVSVYARRGNYQIIAESMMLAGVGEILKLLERRKQKLAAEGLFDEERKRPIPLYPTRVAVVTSPTGAAIRDILNVVGRRSAGVDLVVLPAPVQGEEAAARIAAQIERANRYDLGEVIIIGRGGGSLEDLLPFSEEVVVRAVASSRLPVISAVGHEIDVALSDLAADLRAPTPSAAAEVVSARRDELLERVQDIHRDMVRTMHQRIERVRLLAKQFTADNLERSYRALVQPVLLRLDDAKEGILLGMRDRLQSLRARYDIAHGRLESCSPFDVLRRGYAVVRRAEDEAVVRRASDVTVDEELAVQLAEGDLRVVTKETHVP